jgi:hypothetical protein
MKIKRVGVWLLYNICNYLARSGLDSESGTQRKWFALDDLYYRSAIEKFKSKMSLM